jgi:RNA polymerase sigma factor (sigma-70 family)
MEDLRSDEALLEAFLSGESDASRRDDSALNILLERYYNPLKFHIYKYRLSWNLEPAFIDEIIHQTVLKVLRAIQSSQFTPSGIGVFKAFLFETCKRTCWEMNRKEKRQMKTTSEAFPKGLPEDIIAKRNMEVDDFDYLRMKLQKILPALNQEEQRLLELIGKGKSYKEIKEQDPILGKHSIDYLMRMMYIIKKKIMKLK